MLKRIARWSRTRGIWEDPHGQIDLLSGHSEPFSETWPTAGTTRDGSAFEQPTPALRTGGSASSSSPLLPTPVTTDAESAGRHSTTSPAMHIGTSLTDWVRLLPTPTINDMGEGKTLEWWDEWTDGMRERHGNGNGHGASLAIEALRLLPTPDASLATRGGKADPERRRAQGHSITLEDVVRGGPTVLRSPDGSTSPDD